MVQNMRAIAIILLLAALAYVLYLWSKRKDQIECPSCGNRVNMYKDECPHCGHEKGRPATTDDIDTGTGTDTVDEDTAELAGADTAAELSEEADEDDEPAAPTEAIETAEEAEDTEPTAADDTAASREADDDDGEDTAEAAGDLTCPECDKEFESVKGLNIHKGMKH